MPIPGLSQEEKEEEMSAGRRALFEYAKNAGLRPTETLEDPDTTFEGTRSLEEALGDSRYYPKEGPVSMLDRVDAASDFASEQKKTASPLYLATMPHTASDPARRDRGYAHQIPLTTRDQEWFSKINPLAKAGMRAGGVYSNTADEIDMNTELFSWPGVESVYKEDPGEFREDVWKKNMSDIELHEITHGIHKDYNSRKFNRIPHSTYKIPPGKGKDTPLAPEDIVRWQGAPLRDFVKGETNAGVKTFGFRELYLKYMTTNVELLPRIAWEMRNRLLQQGDKAKAKLDPEQIHRWLEDPMHIDLRYWLLNDPEGYKKWLDSGWPIDVMQRSVEHKPRPSAAPGLSYPPSERTLMA